MGYYTAARLPSTTACSRPRRSAPTTSAPSWGPPGRIASTSRRGPRAASRRTAFWGYGVFDYPIILDLLEAAGMTWKVYNIGWDNVREGDSDNVSCSGSGGRATGGPARTRRRYFADLEAGTFPRLRSSSPAPQGPRRAPAGRRQVGHADPAEAHPRACGSRSIWDSSAFVLTYDEAGGYFDHVPPPQVDAYGLGIRVPTWVVAVGEARAPRATVSNHTSTLKFIERLFGLPTLASVNHRFDDETPGWGRTTRPPRTAHHGPPAPPRDATPSRRPDGLLRYLATASGRHGRRPNAPPSLPSMSERRSEAPSWRDATAQSLKPRPSSLGR